MNKTMCFILHPPLLQLFDDPIDFLTSTPLNWWLSQTRPSQPSLHTGDQHGYTWVALTIVRFALTSYAAMTSRNFLARDFPVFADWRARVVP